MEFWCTKTLQGLGIGKNTISDKLEEIINTSARLFNTKSLCFSGNK